MIGFTPNPAPQDERPHVDFIAVLNKGRTLWRYSLCRHHADEFVAASRAVGDTFTYHVFHREPGQYCLVCAQLKFDRQPLIYNQVAMEVLEP